MAENCGWVARAQRIADELFRDAPTVEVKEKIPPRHLDRLAEEGFYGLPAPVEFGGVGPDGLPVLADVIAALAGGCLTTTFVWLQHLAPLMAVASVASPEDREFWVGPLAQGRVRSGLAMAHPELIKVRAVEGGYRLTGESAWVTGWGMVDVLLVGGIDANGLLHFFLMDATESDTLVSTDVRLIAVQASRTVSLRFNDHFVPADRLGLTQPQDQFVPSDLFGLRINGFLAIGVAQRCARLLGVDDLDADIADARERLLLASLDELPEARANASLLAARAATRLVVQTGSRSVLADADAGRLYRESGFLLVFGLRPGIKDALLHRLSAPMCATV